MQQEHFLSCFFVRERHIYLFVYATCAQNCWVYFIGSVCRTYHKDTSLGAIVKLREKFVHLSCRILCSWIGAVWHQSVKLVKTDNYRCLLLCLLKQLGYLFLRTMNEGAGEVWGFNKNEIKSCLFCKFLCHKRLATSRRPIKQHPVRSRQLVLFNLFLVFYHKDDTLWQVGL